MKRTDNIKLLKPDYEDKADIMDLNKNADNLDSALAGIKGSLNGKVNSTNAEFYDSFPSVIIDGKVYKLISEDIAKDLLAVKKITKIEES